MARRLKMIMPDDPRRALWDRWVLICILWTYIMVPLQVCRIAHYHAVLFIIDWLVVLTYAADMVVVSRTAINTADEEFVVEPQLVRKLEQTWRRRTRRPQRSASSRAMTRSAASSPSSPPPSGCASGVRQGASRRL